jgi:GT2 family glycosyltransferase|tara:strand:+ start:541 stop:1353 length:813 start_codon:yes stop_codon:yes gene_type:complete
MISIIIVNFNGGPLLGECVKRIGVCVKVGHEVIVFDNNSADGSVDGLDGPHVRVIRHAENLGFAKGNNKALEAASGSWIHFLNPDILVNEKLNDIYEQVLKNPEDNVLYFTRLADEDGKVQEGRMLVPRLSNYLNRMFRPANTMYWSIGASVLMTRKSCDDLHGWPEDYFMYAEDLDLFYSAQRKGMRIQELDCTLIHMGKVSSGAVWSPSERALVVERAFRRFFAKYGSFLEYVIVRSMQLIYQALRFDPEFGLSLRSFVRVTMGGGRS